MDLSKKERKKQVSKNYYIKTREQQLIRVKERDKQLRLTKEGTLHILLIKKRAYTKKHNIPFNLDYEFLLSIATDTCPIFKIPLVWISHGRGSPKNDSPSLDRIIPDLGYVKGNVAFISNLANTIKQTVTEKELYAVADWLHDKRKEVLDAFQGQLAPVPTAPDTPGRKTAARWPFPGAGPREDCDGAHHHQGELFGEDAGHSTQASRGVGLAPRVPKVESPARPPSGACDGHARETFERALEQLRRIRDQRGERPLAGGTLARWAVRLFGNRRVKPIQGPEHKTVQGDKEGTKTIQASRDLHRYTNSSGCW